MAQCTLSSSSFSACGLGSPLASTLSSTPSPVPSTLGGTETEGCWSAMQDEPVVNQVQPDFLEAAEAMRIDDSPGDVDADADMDQKNLIPSMSSMLSKSFIIPAVLLQPPTPLLHQSPRHSHVPILPPPLPKSSAHAVSSRTTGLTVSRRRFIMGPREGCEKCRLRVPGHYGHID
ncbi:hypothetical protein DACRYDRAFT_19888 [Dacryopinax primogenitus]|uniref:Uncharacterized protein n=1 Tax=Dacryopinax primogenitus (strain DJM 731) TaxID=1858805 RepID=M5G514_DACPD|nr:uncharacterized protein DACRYDRAFT_19888 [Dacryopinax primogenitus]EJU05356.1 hypothetical protein DACRYDRAFT_19888 [Dacryopinax primogenitus]